MKVIILCGGKGIRLHNESSYIPKAMVKIGHRPILWHIMKRYALAGFTEFILALGYKGELIRDFFVNYEHYVDDVELSLKNRDVRRLTQHQESEWKIILADTGEHAMSGARISRLKHYVGDDEDFMVTYSDCLADIDLHKLLAFHKKSKKVATVTGVLPRYRAGDFIVHNNMAIGLFDSNKTTDKPQGYLINGGFMIFNRKIFSYLNSFNECKLEVDVFFQLIAEKQLSIYPHMGFWRWLDTDRDYLYLQDLIDKNKMYWLQE